MTNNEHKQYLIDSIAEMEAFCNRLSVKMENTTNDMSYHGFKKVYFSKKQNIQQLKDLLKSQYNHII